MTATTGLPRIPKRKGFRRWWEVRRYMSDAYVISLLEQADDDRHAGHETLLGSKQVTAPLIDEQDPGRTQRLVKQKLYEAAETILLVWQDTEIRTALKELEGSYPPKTWVKAL